MGEQFRPDGQVANLTYRVGIALFLFLLAVYLLTYTPRINSSDGMAMFATAESLVRRGELDIEQLRWMELQQGSYGLDGRLYSRKGIGLPLGLLPLTWLGLGIPWFGPASTSLLFNALITALTAVLILAYLRHLNFSQLTGLIVALTFGLATLAWPYAKSLFSDPFSGLLLLAAAYTLLKFHQSDSGLIYPFLAGLFLGWNVATRYAEALFIPAFGLLLLYYLHLKLRPVKFPPFWPYLRLFLKQFWAVLAAFVMPILLIGLSLMVFNLSRYGDPFSTGYLAEETFSAIWWEGIIGQLFSPGRGLFLYSPILLMSLWGVFPFFRRFPTEAAVALSIILLHLLLYGKWFMWHGGYAWGPRFLIPTLPFWAIFLAPLVAQAWPEQNHSEFDRNSVSVKTQLSKAFLIRFLYLALVGLSLIPQFLSVVIDFSPFQNSLLEMGLPLFARETFFDFAYSPLLKAWRYISPTGLDLAWAWEGRINVWLLVVLLINVILTGIFLGRAWQGRRFSGFDLLPLFSSAAAISLLLIHAHRLPPQTVQQVVETINETIRPGDVVILNDPDLTLPFAERYKGQAPVLGLNTGDSLAPDLEQRLEEITTTHGQVWWLPNWLPPQESAVEQTLLREGFLARQEQFENQRLVLFAFPQGFSTEGHSLDIQFGGIIHLVAAHHSPTVEAGRVLAVELQWQALEPIPADYHVFLHLVNEGGQLITQTDGQPVFWSRPTSTWTVGETIVDRYGLWLPPDTTPGQYQLLIGLYHPGDGQRLLLPDGADAVRLPVMIE